MRTAYDWAQEKIVPVTRDAAKETAYQLLTIARLHARIDHMRDALSHLRSAKAGAAIEVDNNSMLSGRVKTLGEYIEYLNTRIIRLRTALSCIRSTTAGAALAADNSAIQRDAATP